HVYCESVVVRQPIVLGERHCRPAFVSGEHPHPVSVDDGPPVAGGDRADRSSQAPTASLTAVVRGQESVAMLASTGLDAGQRVLAAARAVDRSPVAGSEVNK